MSMLVQELIQRAVAVATRDMDSPVSRAALEASAEPLLPRVLVEVGQRLAADPNRRALVTDTTTVALANGVGSLPDSILVEFLGWAAVTDPADPTMGRKMRWIPDWREFTRPLEPSLGYFTVTGNTFFMTRPGTPYTPGAGMTGDIEVTTAHKPEILIGIVKAKAEVEQEIVVTLARVLRNGWEIIDSVKTAAK